MNARWNLPLSLLAAALLLAIAALHGSGYGYAAAAIAESTLPDFLKGVLPTLWLYPSALMGLLAAVVLLTLRYPTGRPAVLRVIATIIAANAVLGFVLGGLVPGGVLLVVASALWILARIAQHAANDR
ncbi:MAG: hypothetical protein AAF184_17865 [Pseudomonadota bacterium]